MRIERQAAMVAGNGPVTAIGAAAIVGLWMAPAAAQEYCIACSEPAAVYRCVIDGARPGGGQPLQMLCITSMAKEGRHATCGIKRGTVFDCDGPVKRVPWSGGDLPLETPASKAAAKPAPDANEPPKTLLDMAKRSNEQTAEQMKKANDGTKDSAKSTGDAIGNATKKTWDCLASMFKQC
jgi:hypothetical protein